VESVTSTEKNIRFCQIFCANRLGLNYLRGLELFEEVILNDVTYCGVELFTSFGFSDSAQRNCEFCDVGHKVLVITCRRILADYNICPT
jgi:hypothetical protein